MVSIKNYLDKILQFGSLCQCFESIQIAAFSGATFPNESPMQKYRLIIHRHGQLFGYFDSDQPWAREAVRAIAASLGGQGYELELQVADGERRLLESSPTGIKVLASEPLYRPAALDTL